LSLAAASWRAIGTTVDVLVLDGDVDLARAAVTLVLDAADRAYSRFRADSELSRIQARPEAEVTVSALLGEAIDAALRGARLTDGLVDPTIGRALRLAGYDADFRSLLDRSEPLVARIEAIPGWRAITWDPSHRRLRLPAGIELDLGATGKALIVDRAVVAAAAAVGPAAGVLVSVGGDIAIAGRLPDDGWRILLAEDSATPPDAGGEVVSIRDGALATSSTVVRRWRRGAVSLHHLIDPRTGAPAAGPWRTATVAAATCVDANVAATAAIVLGDEAVAWLEATGLPARLVAIDGRVERVGGWPLPDLAVIASTGPAGQTATA